MEKRNKEEIIDDLQEDGVLLGYKDEELENYIRIEFKESLEERRPKKKNRKGGTGGSL